LFAAASTAAPGAAHHRVEHAQPDASASATAHREVGERRAHARVARALRARPRDHLLEVAAHAAGRELDVALVRERLGHDRPRAVLGADPLVDRTRTPSKNTSFSWSPSSVGRGSP
jgi:hypothetical protein